MCIKQYNNISHIVYLYRLIMSRRTASDRCIQTRVVWWRCAYVWTILSRVRIHIPCHIHTYTYYHIYISYLILIFIYYIYYIHIQIRIYTYTYMDGLPLPLAALVAAHRTAHRRRRACIPQAPHQPSPAHAIRSVCMCISVPVYPAIHVLHI